MELRELRIKKAMKLSEVAAYLGISSMQLSRIERGIQGLKVQYAQKLGEIYEVNWADFYAKH